MTFLLLFFNMFPNTFLGPPFLKDTTCTKQNIKNQTALMAWTLGRMMRRRPTAPVKPSITGRWRRRTRRRRTRQDEALIERSGTPVPWRPEVHKLELLRGMVAWRLKRRMVFQWGCGSFFRFFLGSARWKSWTHNKGTVYIPYHTCMVYLPTFGWFLWEM